LMLTLFRFFLQRLARKSGCRLIAINYRLAPQYPFPCAIQDALATCKYIVDWPRFYLMPTLDIYLIRPPPDALHAPIDPANIVVSGDSAGGGLTIALLQVLRDCDLPLPAGGIPISPWCDLTHSFPSIHINTDSDVIPKYGLSIYKPSPLWPPPPDDLTERVHAGLRSRIKEAASHVRGKSHERAPADRPGFWGRFSFIGKSKKLRRSKSQPSNMLNGNSTDDVRPSTIRKSLSNVAMQNGHLENEIEVGAFAPLPTADRTTQQTLWVESASGEKLEVRDQVHMYTQNTLLTHPLVSPAYSYLGGLPPLLIIAGDAEVLRDEIIYTLVHFIFVSCVCIRLTLLSIISAHKAAHPQIYPVKPEARRLYSKLNGIESRCVPTKVHLQVYDRKTLYFNRNILVPNLYHILEAAHILPVLFSFCTPAKFCFRALASFNRHVWNVAHPPSKQNSVDDKPSPRKLVKRSLSNSMTRKRSFLSSDKRRSTAPLVSRKPSVATSEVSETGIMRNRSVSTQSSSSVRLDTITSEAVTESRFAGDPAVYGASPSPYVENMIRERVAINGQIRPLEPESELPACSMPPERLGVVGELAVRRYLDGKSKWSERYGRAEKHIRKMRTRNLLLARKETAIRNVAQLQMHFFQSSNAFAENVDSEKGVKEGLRSAASWAWAWALDGEERPPPSSIVARRDTKEARRLSRIADQPTDEFDHKMNANSLWSFLVNKLSLEKNEANEEREKSELPDAELNGEMGIIASPIGHNGTKTKLPSTQRSRSLFGSGKKGGAIRRFVSTSATISKDRENDLNNEGKSLPRINSM
jgi:acetyl esterase/lipase